MKRIEKLIVLCTILLISGTCAIAQEKQEKKEDWRERVKTEKIAFITSELELTPEEAQVFWPVYNQIEQQRGEIYKKIMITYKALYNAVENKKDVEAALNDYTKALDAQKDFESSQSASFKKVISVEKVAKLYLSEEKFRRQQIHKLHHHNHKK